MSDGEAADTTRVVLRGLEALEKVGGLFRLLLGMFMSLIVSIVGGALWLNRQADAVTNAQQAIAETQRAMVKLEETRASQLREWAEWRARTDLVNERQTVVLENLQRVSERQQAQLDRLTR